MRQKFSLTSAEARAIVTAAKLEAVKNNWKVSIAVVDVYASRPRLMWRDRMALAFRSPRAIGATPAPPTGSWNRAHTKI